MLFSNTSTQVEKIIQLFIRADYETQKLFLENHNLQVRFKWNVNNPEGLSDLAIWDNRSTIHTDKFPLSHEIFVSCFADVLVRTIDFEDQARVGDRVVGCGEKPFYTPSGKDRREALGMPSVRP